MRNLFFLFSFVLLITSCGDKKKVTDFGIGKNTPHSLINNHLMFSSFEDQYSFPVWFNDSVVRDKKINSVTHKIYAMGNSLGEVDSSGFLPVKTVVYYFKKNGKLAKIDEILTHDNHVISNITKKYGRQNERTGFASFKVTKNKNFLAKTEASVEFPIYKVKKSAEKYDRFVLKNSSEELIVIHNSKLWGPYQINKKLHPSPQDKLVLGSMNNPAKVYSVKNTIEETKVEKFEYQKGMISEIVKLDLPFQNKRSFQYDRRGYCISYVDSLFSNDDYLSRTISKFTNNMHFSPIKIVHEKENKNGELGFHYLELFEYEYRK